MKFKRIKNRTELLNHPVEEGINNTGKKNTKEGADGQTLIKSKIIVPNFISQTVFGGVCGRTVNISNTGSQASPVALLPIIRQGTLLHFVSLSLCLWPQGPVVRRLLSA